MVMIRSSLGIKLDKIFKKVVFPAPVPPEMNMLYLAFTSFSRKAAASSETASISNNFSIVITSFGNLRMVITGPFRAIGGTTIFTREPSSSRTSRIGFDSFTIRFPPEAICWAIWSSRSTDSNFLSVFWSLPSFSTKILDGPFTIISVMSSSSRRS